MTFSASSCLAFLLLHLGSCGYSACAIASQSLLLACPFQLPFQSHMLATTTPPTASTSTSTSTATHCHQNMTSQIVYDALVIGGGPAGLSASLALARVCRTSLLFDSGSYRNVGSKAMHTFLSRDGIPPDEFRAIARAQILEKYSAQVTFRQTKVVKAVKKEILEGYKGFELTDQEGVVWRGRKLVLATGTEDLLPTDIEGYEANWPAHM